MDKWLMDFDEFMGEHVLITSFNSGSLEGILTDYDDDYLELLLEDEYIKVPIEPVRNIRIVE